MPFACSICEQESTQICARCTKDACSNHLCERCRRCSDCCECEISLDEHPHESARAALYKAAGHAVLPTPEPEPEPPPPPPGPDPLPPEEPEPGPIAP